MNNIFKHIYNANRKNASRLLVFFCFIFINITFAENRTVTIKTSVDTATATVGDRIELNIKMLYPEDITFGFPELQKTLGKFEVISQLKDKPIKISNGFERNWILTLAIFDTGKVEIPPLKFRAFNRNDSTTILDFESDPKLISVISVLPPEKAEPKDIKPPFPIRMSIPRDIVIFVLILIAILIIWYFTNKRWKKRQRPEMFDEKYLEPPYLVAVKRLNQIKKENKYETAAEKKDYYFSISEILREYLERRFFVRALEMSTREIHNELVNINVDKIAITEFDMVFRDLDIIKFADQIPEDGQKETIWQKAFNCVEKTRHEHFLSQRSELTDLLDKAIK